MADEGIDVGVAEVGDFLVLEIRANGAEQGVHIWQLRVVAVRAAGDDGLVVGHVAEVGAHHHVAHSAVGAIMEVSRYAAFFPHADMVDGFQGLVDGVFAALLGIDVGWHRPRHGIIP